MSKKLVYICSPCRGDYEKNISDARYICQIVMNHYPDAIPIAPHIYFTQFLDDNNPDERSRGMEAALTLLDMCDEIWVYGIDNPSEGMRAEIEYAKKHGIKIRNGFDRNSQKAQPEEELGDVLITLPTLTENLNGMADTEPQTVTITGASILEMAKILKRNRGRDITIENWRRKPSAESCVCCGETIPEGRQVCPSCMNKAGVTE